MKQIEIYTDGACSGNPPPAAGGPFAVPYRTESVREGAFRRRGQHHQQPHGDDRPAGSPAPVEKALRHRFVQRRQYVINRLEKAGPRGGAPAREEKADKSPALNPDLWAPAFGRKRKAQDYLPLAEGPRRPPEKALRPHGRGQSKKYGGRPSITHPPTYKIRRKTMDGFNTFEKQDKVLLGLNSGADAQQPTAFAAAGGFAVLTFTAERYCRLPRRPGHAAAAVGRAGRPSWTAPLSPPGIMPALKWTRRRVTSLPLWMPRLTRVPCWLTCRRNCWPSWCCPGRVQQGGCRRIAAAKAE